MSSSASCGASIKDTLRQIPSLKAPLPELDLADMPATPEQAFALWLNEALAAGIREPHAMTLSTVDEHGWPDARVLILKNVDAEGWHFALKGNSPKARQLDYHPQAALTFYWPALGKQIRLRGHVHLLPEQICADDFLGRPLGSRASAIASRQSEVLHDETELHQRLKEAQVYLDTHPDHVEPGWRVYALTPHIVEFWQGASDRNHKRLRYTRNAQGLEWATVRLWP
ncbi:pyridoxal 5'-phosphate synthase [Alcaligenes sp. A-TC2]|uniref:pyridoxine/pyridoxamine 5'-phosphate oxidase n=1 Tax=Alcaligenes nematophilus TaxID=2994643 RepID=UPI00225C10E6|nr:pyridoxal 5'-phosphate synthase [Alcaligenes nematophilus]MCX5473328.1 pyridoxal 5'-phosphate synthase [Alcaligenes nematophilus]MDK7585930.1 pyridoxal 5'-phosphate synthase [Alcaligenes phenolicus]